MSTVADIVKANAFVGQPKNKSNPKTSEHRLGVKNGMVAFDPNVIADQLEVAKKKIQEAKKSHKHVLVICEKSLYKEELEELSGKAGFHYLNHKVPSGVMTNFDTLLSRIRGLKDLRNFVDSSGFSTLTKKEQSMKKRELAKVEKVYKGVVDLKKKPDLVVIVDGQFMHKFVAEVEKLKCDAIVLASSDFNKVMNDKVVMCNTNSHSSIDYVLKYIFG